MSVLRSALAGLLLLLSSEAIGQSTNVDVTITAGGSSDEEFVGPFPSWSCARSAASGTCGAAAASFCNADGTGGATDDTTEVQACITALSASNTVIYFPCGTYNISTTLTLVAHQYAALIGQDNSTAGGRCTTTLKWTGSNGGTLFNIDGTAYSQLVRLTFDGNSLANILVDQSWSGAGAFDASNQYIDTVFKNGNNATTSYGLRCGALGAGCSEVNLLRNNFSNLGFGVAALNANALDIWVWYSKFTNVNVGAKNNWNVAGSIFEGSTSADLISDGFAPLNAIDSYSLNSNRFVNTTNANFQRNTIINSTTPGTVFSNGNILLLDNHISNTDTSSPYVLDYIRNLSLGNRYSNSSPFNGWVFGATYALGDTTVSPSTPGPPTLTGTLPNNGRTIYEAAPSGSGTTCTAASPCSVQTAICKASNGAASTFSGGACTGTADRLKNVAHFPVGSYTISSTIEVPVNSNAQIIGDGWYTTLSGTVNPLIRINGPSQVTLRSFHPHSSSGTNDGISISGVDQVGAYVYFRSGRYSSNTTSSLTMSGLANVLVQADNLQTSFNSSLHDVFHSGSNHFNQFFGTGSRLNASGAANLVFIGGWFEASGFSPTHNITGTGSFIYSGAQYAFENPYDGFVFNNFTGTAALLNIPMLIPFPMCPQTGYPIKATGSGSSGLIISVFNTFARTDPVLNTAGTPLQQLAGLVTRCVGDSGMTDAPTTPSVSTVSSALQYLRKARPMQSYPNPPGITGLKIYDIFGEGFSRSVYIVP